MALRTENITDSRRKYANRPYGIGVTLKCFFRVDTAALPDAYCSVLTTREYPSITARTAAGIEAAGRARCERGDHAFVASVSEASLNIQIGGAGSRVKVLVRRRNDPALDRAIVSCGTHLGFAWATTTTENYTSNNIEMTPQREFDLELRRIGILIRVGAIVCFGLAL